MELTEAPDGPGRMKWRGRDLRRVEKLFGKLLRAILLTGRRTGTVVGRRENASVSAGNVARMIFVESHDPHGVFTIDLIFHRSPCDAEDRVV